MLFFSVKRFCLSIVARKFTEIYFIYLQLFEEEVIYLNEKLFYFALHYLLQLHVSFSKFQSLINDFIYSLLINCLKLTVLEILLSKKFLKISVKNFIYYLFHIVNK